MKKQQKINDRLKKIVLSLIIFSVFTSQVYGFSFVVLGDSRNGKDVAPVFRIIMKEVNLLSPEFVVHTGDWVGYPSKEGWENFLKVMKIGGVPFHLVIGNHEVNKNWKSWYSLYKKMIKKPLYYSFKYENCSFIILCCYFEENGKTVGRKIDKQQFIWLKKELEKAKESDFIFVFFHEPLYPVDGHVGSSLDRYPEERDKLANLLRKYKDKVIVFCGHEHLYNKSVIDGLSQIITGGAGAPPYTSPEKGGFYHYLYVTVKGKFLQMAVIKPGNIISSEPPEETILISRGDKKWFYTRDYPATTPPDRDGKKWYDVGYDISDWEKGDAPFGFGDEPRAKYGTKLLNNNGSYFFRKVFNVKNLKDIKSIILRVASDNSAIIYINGKEIDRDPEFGKVGGHEFAYWNREIEIEPYILKEGENLIAVYLYNNPGSSDAYLDIELVVNTNKD